jgi:2-succinyl-6-hydroxy-2,4-cyclohexadiene-1-carboxylate synthase
MSGRGARSSELVQFVEAGGVRLRALVDGQGPPVVLLHGFTGACESMADLAERLRARHRIVRVDLVGHGQSDAPREPAAYTMESCTEQLAAISAALAPEAHWLGYSMGGRAALALAVRHPERVRSLLAVGASAGLRDPAARAQRIRDDEALADAIEQEGLEKFVDRWMALPLFSSQTRLGAEALASAREQRLRSRPHGLANSLRGMGAGAQPPLFESLARLAAPACFVAGAEDAKFRALAAELAALAPHGESRIVANAGHAAHLEAPAAFASLALEFFAAVDAQPIARAHPA